MPGKTVRLIAAVTAIGSCLLLAGGASATTFCVPGYFAACPDNGTNQLAPSGTTPGEKLQAALSPGGLAGDGEPDTVRLAPGSYTVPDNFKPVGSDDLLVAGSGREKTSLTSSSTGNIYLMNLAGRSGEVTVRDLSLIIPASFPDGGMSGYGAGVQAAGDTFERVGLVNRNPGSGGFANLIGGGRLKDVRITSDNSSPFGYAIDHSPCATGQLLIENLEMEWGGMGIRAVCPQAPVTVNGLRAESTDTVLTVRKGANVNVVNAAITGGSGIPVKVEEPAATPTTLAFDHLTLVAGSDPAQPGIRVLTGGASGFAQVGLRNSVVTGFDTPWYLGASPAPSSNHVDFEAAWSFFDHPGTEIGDVTANTTEHVIFGDAAGLTPGFSDAEYHLAPDSPLVDAGDPDQALPKTDLDGNRRPLDGDRDGTVIRDIGAFEYVPSLRALRLRILKFRYRTGRGGRLVFRISHRARVRAVFTPVRKRTRAGKKRKVARVVRRVKAGRVVIRLGERRLSRGRYRLKLTAITPDGSAAAGVRRTVRVR